MTVQTHESIWGIEGAQERLAELWGQGLSAAICADRLSAEFDFLVTRSAIVGKTNRMGLARRKTLQKKAPTCRQCGRTKPQTPKLADPEPVPEPMPEPVVMPEQRAADGCKWPFGDPGDADYHSCGAARVPGKPYCAAHMARAYQPLPEKKTERKNTHPKTNKTFLFGRDVA